MKAMLLAAAMCLVAASAAAEDPPVEILTRSGRWVANYDKDACHLYAQFGTGKAAMALRITQISPGDWFQVAVYGTRMRSDEVRTEALLDFGPGGGKATLEGVNASAGAFPLTIYPSVRLDGWTWKRDIAEAPRVAPELEIAVTGLTVKVKRKRAFHLEFGSLAKPFAEMRKCLDNLVKSWGYDPVEQASLQRRPVPLDVRGGWLHDDDYPRTAALFGHEGLVQVRIDVSAEGTVAGCYILRRTEPDDFADITCRNITKRARFQPALNAAGKPVRAYLTQQFRWQLAQ